MHLNFGPVEFVEIAFDGFGGRDDREPAFGYAGERRDVVPCRIFMLK